MSVKIMGMVWDLDIPRDEKFVLLAYADHADHEGKNIYPSIATICKKTGYSERSVQEITRKLENRGLLIPDGAGPNGTRRWKFGGAEIAGVQKTASGGAEITPEGAAHCTGGVQNLQGEGAAHCTGGVQPTAPEPSFNHPINHPLNHQLNHPLTSDEVIGIFKTVAHYTPDYMTLERVRIAIQDIMNNHPDWTEAEITAHLDKYFQDWCHRKSKDGKPYSKKNVAWIENAAAEEKLPETVAAPSTFTGEGIYV